MRKSFGGALRSVAEPHRRESYVGRIATVGGGGKSIAVTNMNKSQLRNLAPITPYGVASSPPVGLMAYVLVSDNSSRDGIIGVYDPNKPQCSPGNSMIYSSGGASVHCNGKLVLINTRNVLNEIDDIKKEIGSIKQSISNLQKEVGTANSNITNLQNDVNNLKNKL